MIRSIENGYFVEVNTLVSFSRENINFLYDLNLGHDHVKSKFRSCDITPKGQFCLELLNLVKQLLKTDLDLN